MESVDANVSKTSTEPVLVAPKWTEVISSPGERTNKLIQENPNLGRLEPIKILENIKPGSDTGIILFPGGLDLATEDEALKWGEELGVSVFHIKYPVDSSFSIDREVSQIIDHTREAGIRNYKIMNGSWGGIPAFKTVYNLLKEDGVNVDCFIGVAAALQPTDFAPMVRAAGIASAPILTLTRGFEFPRRQLMARIAMGVHDAPYDNPILIDKIKQIPTLLLVPPGSEDWWVNAKKSYEKYFPNATKIEYPAYSNFIGKIKTIGGHNSISLLPEIQQIERSFLLSHKIDTTLLSGFKLLK